MSRENRRREEDQGQGPRRTDETSGLPEEGGRVLEARVGGRAEFEKECLVWMEMLGGKEGDSVDFRNLIGAVGRAC